MLHPSYSDLMNVVNKDVDVEHGETPVVSSRYSIVMAASKRARQLTDGEDPLVPVNEKDKPLSIAVEEICEGKVRILSGDEETGEVEQTDEE
ncbi:MAG: DNA-directed RNA polymerase subunit omega [Lachnospiraceae bacterium]|nr:DNA-directed RNA polymerase subunit omega [Lachnospiraceae bacterium]